MYHEYGIQRKKQINITYMLLTWFISLIVTFQIKGISRFKCVTLEEIEKVMEFTTHRKNTS